MDSRDVAEVLICSALGAISQHGFDGDDPDVAAALESLRAHGPLTYRLLRDQLSLASTAEERLVLLWVEASLPDPAATSIFRDIFTNPCEPSELRTVALEGLVRVDPVLARDTLPSVLLQTDPRDHASLRLRIIGSMAQLPTSLEAETVIMSEFWRVTEIEQTTIVTVLGWSEFPSRVSFLAGIATDNSLRYPVRAVGIEALARIATPAALDVLQDVTLDPAAPRELRDYAGLLYTSSSTR